jgi:predicted metal-dependent hydrolase
MPSSTSGTFIVGRQEIKYYVTEQPNSKNVRLKLKPGLALEVSLPKGSRIDVESLLRKKRNWISKKSEEIANSRQVFDGKRLLLGGVPYAAEFSASKQSGVSIGVNKVVISCTDDQDAKVALNDWMRDETKRLVQERLVQNGSKLGLKVDNFTVTDLKKWGHCTRDGKLAFNWQLAGLPVDLVDYVVLHELVHLREFNHSGRFKRVLASVCPDYREREAALKLFVTA